MPRNANDPVFLLAQLDLGPDAAWEQYLEGMGIRRNPPEPRGMWEDELHLGNIIGENLLQPAFMHRTEQREEARRNREQVEINELRERLVQGRRRLERIQRQRLSPADRRDMREVGEVFWQMEDELMARQLQVDFLAEYASPGNEQHQGDFLNEDADSDTEPNPYKELLEATDRYGRETLAALRRLGDRLR
jgi:hypothetical protein